MHLGKDSECPPPVPGKKRLYYSRFCPFSGRARLALAAKSIDYEAVKIKLRNDKPPWYMEVNPKGSVPCLVLEDGTKIADSGDIVEFADSHSNTGPKLSLVTDDEKEKHQQLMGEHSKLHKAWHALMYDEGVNQNELLATMKAVMQFYEQNMVGPYMQGGELRTTDLLLFPWFERLESGFVMAKEEYPAADFPKISAYIDKMKSLDFVKSCIETTDVHYRMALGFGRDGFDYEMK